MILTRGGAGNWQQREQQSLKFNILFRRPIIAGQNSSRKGAPLQFKTTKLHYFTTITLTGFKELDS